MRRLLLLVLLPLLSLLSTSASAATLVVDVRDARGAAVTEAVVYALPVGRQFPPASRTAVMDQKNRTFIPHVLAIQTGTAVRFPNSDDIRHQVYSFSSAKTFQLPLYKGTPANPVRFDKSGVVSLGCNIHDRMSAYIVIVDTPHFAVTKNGRTEIASVGAGRYALHVWYPEMKDAPPPVALTLAATDTKALTVTVRK